MRNNRVPEPSNPPLGPSSTCNTEYIFGPASSCPPTELESILNTGDDGTTVQIGKPSLLLRQSSCSEQRECFCSDAVGNDPEHDIRLACRCLIHRSCLISYIRSQLGDRAQLFAAMESAGQIGIICPYAGAGQCNAIGKEMFISVKDMDQLVTSKVVDTVGADKAALPEETLLPRELERLRVWIEEEKGSKVAESKINPEQEVAKKKEADKKKQAEMDLMTDVFIASTTKACPSCQFRVTHWHGHSCHHIQPSGGCPKCKVPFCYKCLQPGPVNSKKRGSANACLCGGWSNFCQTSNVKENLNLLPYPYDKRCGCFICPDCAPGQPCGTCTGHCVVCLGKIPPGPREINTAWSAADTDSNGGTSIRPPRRPVNPVAELFAACQAADTNRIIQALSLPNAPSVNIRDNLQRTPLFYAIDRSSVECVTLLLNVYQADASVMDNSRNTPLHHAAEIGNVDIALLLLGQPRVKVNAVNTQGVTALHTAIGHNAVALYHLLVSHGADTKAIDAQGRSPLHIACEHGYEEITADLIQNQQVKIYKQDNQGKTPVHYAASSGVLTIALQLVESASHDQQVLATQSTATAAATASAARQEAILETARKEAIQKLLHVKDKVGKIPLHYAIQHGRTDVVHYLLEQAPDSIFETTGSQKKTILMYAAEKNNVSIIEAILSAREKVPTRKKLASGIAGFFGMTAAQLTEDEISFINETINNETALYVAFETRSYATATCLIRHGCSLYDAYGMLLDACRRGDLEMLRVLINERKVPVLVQNAYAQHPPVAAMSQGRISRDIAEYMGENNAASSSLIHAACLQPDVLSMLLSSTTLPVHTAASAISSSSSTPNANPTVDKAKDRDLPGLKTPKSNRSPLEIVCAHILKEVPKPPVQTATTNPLAAFGRWLFGLTDTNTNAGRNTIGLNRSYPEILDEYRQKLTQSMLSLQLMIQYRGEQIRLQEILLFEQTKSFDPLKSSINKNADSVKVSFLEMLCTNDFSTLNGANNNNENRIPTQVSALFRICIQNEIAKHGLQLREMPYFPEYNVRTVLSSTTVKNNTFITQLLRKIFQHDKADMLQMLISEFSLPVDTIIDIAHEWTLLHYASTNNRAKIADMLINANANVNATDHEGRQPLHLVCSQVVAEYLIQGHANIHAKDHQQRTPLHCAAENDATKVVAYFLSRKLRRYDVETGNFLSLIDNLLSRNRPKTNPRTPRAYYNDSDCYKCKDANGHTPYHYASVHNGQLKVLFENDKKELKRYEDAYTGVVALIGFCVFMILSVFIVPDTKLWIFKLMHWLFSALVICLIGYMSTVGTILLQQELLKKHNITSPIMYTGSIVLGLVTFVKVSRWWLGT